MWVVNNQEQGVCFIKRRTPGWKSNRKGGRERYREKRAIVSLMHCGYNQACFKQLFFQSIELINK